MQASERRTNRAAGGLSKCGLGCMLRASQFIKQNRPTCLIYVSRYRNTLKWRYCSKKCWDHLKLVSNFRFFKISYLKMMNQYDISWCQTLHMKKLMVKCKSSHSLNLSCSRHYPQRSTLHSRRGFFCGGRGGISEQVKYK